MGIASVLWRLPHKQVVAPPESVRDIAFSCPAICASTAPEQCRHPHVEQCIDRAHRFPRQYAGCPFGVRALCQGPICRHAIASVQTSTRFALLVVAPSIKPRRATFDGSLSLYSPPLAPSNRCQGASRAKKREPKLPFFERQRKTNYLERPLIASCDTG